MSKLQIKKAASRLRRQRSVRAKIKGTPAQRPFVCVSLQQAHIYAQLIDDQARRTLALNVDRVPELKDSIWVRRRPSCTCCGQRLLRNVRSRN